MPIVIFRYWYGVTAMNTKVRVVLIFLGVWLLGGCQTMQVPLSTQTRNAELYVDADPKTVVPDKLHQLKVGMCEHEVFATLGITHETPNLMNLRVEDLFQHVSLLNGRTVEPASCVAVHEAEVPYIGHRLPFTNIRNTGYVKSIKWVRRSQGADWYVDIIFYRGAFISYAVGGELNRDTLDSAYPWESVLSNPYGEIGDTLR